MSTRLRPTWMAGGGCGYASEVEVPAYPVGSIVVWHASRRAICNIKLAQYYLPMRQSQRANRQRLRAGS